MARWLAAIPVYNEVKHVDGVLDEVLRYATDVLAVDDGSKDGTTELLKKRHDIAVIHHPQNRGSAGWCPNCLDRESVRVR